MGKKVGGRNGGIEGEEKCGSGREVDRKVGGMWGRIYGDVGGG